MRRLGVHEARTRLSALLGEVEAGESFAITKHGRPVALLVPIGGTSRELTTRAAVDGLRAFQARHRLGGATSIRSLIDDGRRRTSRKG